MSIYDYSQTPSSNTTVGGNSVAEGAAAGLVNNAIRGFVAEIAEWRDDLGGALTSGGTADAQTLNTNGTVGALADGIMVSFVAGATNTTTTATLDVDALGAKKMRRLGDTALLAGDITSGNHYLAQYDASADSAAGGWIILNPSKIADGALSTNIGRLGTAETVTGAWEFTNTVRVANNTYGGYAGSIIAGTAGDMVLRPTSAADTDDVTRDFFFNKANTRWQFDEVPYVGADAIWHAGNDGSGSGLDADTLDGVQGSAYAALADNETVTGSWTINQGASLTFSAGFDTASDTEGVQIQSTANIGRITVQGNTGVAATADLWQGYQGSTQTSAIEINGDFESATNSYGALSDRREKQQIADLPSLWANFKDIRFRRFKLNGEVASMGADAPLRAGVIADELAAVPQFRVAVDLHETEDERDVVNYSAIYVAQGKVLQEAMARIEALEAQVAALQAAP